MAAAKSLLSPWMGGDAEVCKTFAVDRAAIEKKLRGEARAKRQAKPAAKVKGKR